MGTFDYKVNYDTMKVGTIIQALFNPDPTKFLALDGGDYNAGDWPELVNDSTGKRIFPGVFTSTARTLAQSPASAVVISDGTNFCAAGAAGPSCLQDSSDGISWSAGSAWAASTSFTSMIWANGRFILAGNGGDATAPYIKASTGVSVSKVGFTATTGGTTTTLTQGLAYGSTANAGAGRTVLCVNGSLATASGLFYMNDGATVWNACSGGSTATRYAIVWSGKQFIVLTSLGALQTSSDGITFTDVVIPQAQFLVNNFIASDGNGTVVISYGAYALVSKDGGTSWKTVLMPSENQVDQGSSAVIFAGGLSYVNGKFIATSSSAIAGCAISVDGLQWSFEPIATRGIASGSAQAMRFAYKAGTYCGINTTTSAITSTENMSKFRIPASKRTISAATNYNSLTQYQEFIKARS